jgi:hypothetical protein
MTPRSIARLNDPAPASVIRVRSRFKIPFSRETLSRFLVNQPLTLAQGGAKEFPK